MIDEIATAIREIDATLAAMIARAIVETSTRDPEYRSELATNLDMRHALREALAKGRAK